MLVASTGAFVALAASAAGNARRPTAPREARALHEYHTSTRMSPRRNTNCTGTTQVRNASEAVSLWRTVRGHPERVQARCVQCFWEIQQAMRGSYALTCAAALLFHEFQQVPFFVQSVYGIRSSRNTYHCIGSRCGVYAPKPCAVRCSLDFGQTPVLEEWQAPRTHAGYPTLRLAMALGTFGESLTTSLHCGWRTLVRSARPSRGRRPEDVTGRRAPGSLGNGARHGLAARSDKVFINVVQWGDTHECTGVLYLPQSRPYGRSGTYPWFGDIHGPNPYEFIGSRWAFISQTPVVCRLQVDTESPLYLRTL